jgi:tripartite-type tricarboxylate transporter receptor subunit TctC
VPLAPGGGSDILARLLQPALEKKLGVPVIVDNRPDAAAVMGATIVTKAKPDGYTLRLYRHHLAGTGAGNPDRASRRAGEDPG